MDRRKFIGASLSGLGLTSFGCAFCMQNAGDSLLTRAGTEHTREAMFYRLLPNGAKCELCPIRCSVTLNRPGDCKTRTFRDGKLYTEAYGNPYYTNIVKPESLSLYHFSPGSDLFSFGTAGCNLQCLFCKVNSVSQKSPHQTSHKVFFPEDIIAYCKKKEIKTIAYSYTEPIAFFEYMLETAKLARQSNIRNVITSNGYINPAPLKMLCQYTDAAVIDVKAFSDATYQKLSCGTIEPVFDSLKILKDEGVWLEISHLLVPGYTDNYDLIGEMGNWMVQNGFKHTPFHINRFIPAYRLSQLPPTADDSILKAGEILRSSGLNYVYADDPKANTTFCPNCHNPFIIRQNSTISSLAISYGACSNCGYKVEGVWN